MDLVKNKAKNAEYEKRARELVAQMTLEEKAFQMVNGAPAIERLGIKAYNWWNEALHGVARAGTATVFPQAISLAATFDEDLIEEVADAISTEGRAKFNAQQKYDDLDIYKGLTFWSPNVNIFRDPRWGRGHETFGEDPYLTSRLGVRFVEGLQGHDENYLKAAACAKHFAVHSGPEDLRHEFNAVADKQDLYETYLPAFRACVQEAGVEAVMGAYNRTNGEPCCGSKTLLQDILRGEWGFKGHVVSDCWAIKDFHNGHGVTAGAEESVAMAVNNGCDLNCGDLFLYVADAVKKGMIEEERVDEALVHLFMTRMKLGLFEGKEKTPFDDIPYTAVDSAQMRELNLKAAQKCIVLLKNENGLLPLAENKIKTIGVIGPNANNRKALVGNYEGTASRYVTIAEGIQDYVGEKIRVLVSEGCHLYKKQISNLSQGKDRDSEVKAVCEASDVVIMCLGLDPGLEGEEGDQGNQYASGDKPDLELPGRQQEILEIACASGKPVVLVLLSGSALAVNWAQEHVPAIMQGWYPGAQGGRAIASILFGEKNPEGRMPVTFYKTSEELPDFTDYSMKGRTYRYMENEALYPFGYGLSYTDFTYTDASVSSDTVGRSGLTVKAIVHNTGEREGVETVQVYVKAKRGNTPNAQLKGMKKVFLQAGESREVEIMLPGNAFALYDEQGVNRMEAGDYLVSIGGSQPEGRSEKLTGKKVAGLTVRVEETVIL
ncbi:MAG: glycoside hydrolase family 3 C-terminal domain-containing protein [Roseburia sp.]|nr:glycoside hydrolase family 3 C-terminal domain-containing protein [Ruminococcus sp.]MCM1156311.1 glycoside hydrolase family 3 C-terminal domain-containing protein [Roseburia sp.]MCM1242363.1 glycoside hydrolase family 3 C-terminal domain-containing protein [Roseburia sp.]